MERDVREAAAALADALSRGDAAGAAALYVDDAKLLTPRTELVAGRGEIESYWRTGIDLGVTRVGLEMLELGLAGAVAVEIGRYTILLSADRGDAIIDRGKYLALHKQQPDGSWRRAVDVFNPDGQISARPTSEGAHS
jgi:ketosteroid isomerase-like protein